MTPVLAAAILTGANRIRSEHAKGYFCQKPWLCDLTSVDGSHNHHSVPNRI
jgi:hypothetical protein